MQFNSYIFILAFLPVVVVMYFALSRLPKIQSAFLVLASFTFYAYAGMDALKWFICSIVINLVFVCLLRAKCGGKVLQGIIFGFLTHGKTAGKEQSGSGLSDEKGNYRKIVLTIGIAVNVLLLFYFKYLNFSIATVNALMKLDISPKDIILPLGISFFTFQQIAYLADSYRGVNSEYTLFDYIMYISYFPKLLMGPIVKPSTLISRFRDASARKLNLDNLIDGIQLFNIGLFKKVLLADTFARAVNWGFADPNAATSMDLIIVMLSYTFQIYFDFSGYSDMAIGVSRMLNIELPMNFDSPYKSFSIREFWKRWHISLTQFLTEYIYIPLGGNRSGGARTYLNTIVVFLISGLWHGANWTFVLWGLLHGALSVFDRITAKYRKAIHPAFQWLCCFAAINLLWLLFRADSITQWFGMLKHIASFYSTAISDGLISCFIQPEQAFIIKLLHLWPISSRMRGFAMMSFLFGGILICLGFENACRRQQSRAFLTAVISSALLVFSLTCIGQESVFVYFNF